MEILAFLALIFTFFVLANSVATPGKLRARAIRCYEVNTPHAWETKIQPGFEGYEHQPKYLQCKKCGMIFGEEK